MRYVLMPFVVLLFFAVPLPRFESSTSTVVYSKEGHLLGAKISDDEQWRFSLIDSVPHNFKVCITQFEDRWFYCHPGINPAAIVRAAIQNVKARKVVSGGSTITMQTMRLLRGGKPRTFAEKLIEMFFALRYELCYPKDDIMRLYVSHAPFGGNVVGLEAASWRYFNRSPNNLTWAEAATLAVLPNAPSLIYPGKNQEALFKKRNALLKKLIDKGIIDSTSYQLGIAEELPIKPRALPHPAPHFFDFVAQKHKGERLHSGIDFSIQSELRRMLNNHSKLLSSNEIHNAAALVVDNESGTIIAYVGNSDYTMSNANSVDIIRSARSTGSIIKPLLLAFMLDDGELLPHMLVPDIPMFFEGFSPKNYKLSYDGAVKASEALSRSLNLPFVYLLKKYGTARFYSRLQQVGFTSIAHAPEHYGLSLILGGAEVSLWELTQVYAGMARTLSHVPENAYRYANTDFCSLNYRAHQPPEKHTLHNEKTLLSAGAIWQTFEAMLELNRPNNQAGWKSYHSSKKIAWKTGTSFGFRDAWALGVSPRYTVGVWVGNANGEGRPGLTGIEAAAPLLFNIFDLLKPETWFQEPYDEFSPLRVCSKSGYPASRHCLQTEILDALRVNVKIHPCPYHKTIQLDSSGTYRVSSQCYNPAQAIQKSWFTLPATMAWYYKKQQADYKDLPPFMPSCEREDANVMDFVYPRNVSKVYIPLNADNEREEVVFEVAHSRSDAKLFWHLDNEFIGETETFHQLGLNPNAGRHTITVVDEQGNAISKRIWFEK